MTGIKYLNLEIISNCTLEIVRSGMEYEVDWAESGPTLFSRNKESYLLTEKET